MSEEKKPFVFGETHLKNEDLPIMKYVHVDGLDEVQPKVVIEDGVRHVYYPTVVVTSEDLARHEAEKRDPKRINSEFLKKPTKIVDALYKGTEEGVRIELDRVADVTYHGPLGSENIVDKEIDRKVLGGGIGIHPPTSEIIDPLGDEMANKIRETNLCAEITGVTITPEEQRQGYSWTTKLEVKDGQIVNLGAPISQTTPRDIPPWEDVPSSEGKESTVYMPAKGGLIKAEVKEMPENAFEGGWGAELPPQEQTPEVQGGIPSDKLREVTVPFPAEKIREYFMDKSLFFIANYSESKLKGGAFLTYLSNINIPSDVKFNTPISYEEYAEIMKAYMEQPGVINCAGLHVMAAEMLLVAKGLPYDRSPYALPIDEEVLKKFIDEYKYLVEKWIHFIDSTQVFALRSIKALNDFYNPDTRFPVVEDRSYVGWNIAQLFRIPEFIAVYFSIEGATYQLSYFKDQYEEYMFKNETLAKYFQSQNNFAALYFMHYASGLFQPADISHGLFRIGVFDPNSEFFEKTPYDFRIQE